MEWYIVTWFNLEKQSFLDLVINGFYTYYDDNSIYKNFINHYNILHNNVLRLIL